MLCEVKNLSFAYDKVEVLQNVNLSIKQGDFWAFIGPNGGGKSTFLKLLLGLLQIQRGSIRFFDLDKSQIGYVPQHTDGNLQFPIQTQDVIQMGFLHKKIFGYRNNKAQQNRIFEIMEQLDILHLHKKLVGNLSGGERQKVLIARALVNNPKLIILDEPTSNIDVKAQEHIYKLLHKLNKKHTILVVTHDLSVSLGYAKSVLYINKSAIIHHVPKFELDLDSHLCEVDMLNYFAHAKSMHGCECDMKSIESSIDCKCCTSSSVCDKRLDSSNKTGQKLC